MFATNTNLSTEVKNQLNEHAINLADVESISAFAQRINAEAFDIAELAKFRRKIGLDQSVQSQDQPTSTGGEIVMLGVDDMDQLYSMNVPASDVTIKDFFTPNNRTMVYGDSHVGKSYILQSIALGCTTGTPSFFFSAAPATKIVYLDGELGDSFLPRLYQLNGGHITQQIKNNFRAIPLRGISLVYKDNQEQVLNNLKNFNPDIVIIDNLIALFSEAIRGNIYCLHSFVANIERMGAAIIMVHHTDKYARTYKGPSEFAALCQNIIHLKGREQIKEQFKKENLEIPETLSKAIESEKNGTVISMIVEKCKVCPELQWQSHYYCLPINGQWRRIDIEQLASEDNDNLKSGPTSAGDQTEDNTSTADESTRNQQDKAITLPPDERKVFEFMKKHPGGVKRAEIDEALGWSENTSGKILKSLIRKAIVVRHGEGKNQYYVLNPDAKNVIA